MTITIGAYKFEKIDNSQKLQFRLNDETVIEVFFMQDEEEKVINVYITYEEYVVGQLIPECVEKKLKKELKKYYPYGFFPKCGGAEWDC